MNTTSNAAASAAPHLRNRGTRISTPARVSEIARHNVSAMLSCEGTNNCSENWAQRNGSMAFHTPVVINRIAIKTAATWAPIFFHDGISAAWLRDPAVAAASMTVVYLKFVAVAHSLRPFAMMRIRAAASPVPLKVRRISMQNMLVPMVVEQTSRGERYRLRHLFAAAPKENIIFWALPSTITSPT